mgnify:CR=1 FL=1
MRTGTTNPNLKKLIRELKRLSRKNNVNTWRAVAEILEKPTRRRVDVNIDKINRICKDNETIIIPGKVLGSGILNKKVTIAAWKFSDQAKEKIKHHLTIEQLIEKNPKGKDVRIIT